MSFNNLSNTLELLSSSPCLKTTPPRPVDQSNQSKEKFFFSFFFLMLFLHAPFTFVNARHVRHSIEFHSQASFLHRNLFHNLARTRLQRTMHLRARNIASLLLRYYSLAIWNRQRVSARCVIVFRKL